MIPPARPRFYNARARLRRALAQVTNEGRLGFALTRRSWNWVVHGPGRVLRHPVLRRVAFGLPAAVVAVAAVTVLAFNPRADQNKFRSRYRADAERAVAAKQWQEAIVRYQRLAAETGYSADDVYGLARALEGAGRGDEAEALFIRVAPDGATGHPAAHVRRAKQLLAENPPAVQRAEAHLMRALYARPNFPEAHDLLGRLKMATGDKDEAIKHFLLAAPAFPELSLQLALLYSGRDADAALHWATVAIETFGPAVTVYPDNAQMRFCYAMALRLANRYADAADVIRAGLARHDDVQLRILAGDVYAAWCATLTGDSRAAEQQRRVEEGCELNPTAGPLLQAWAATAAGAGPVAEMAKASAEKRMAEGGVIAVGLRLMFGVEAQRHGNVSEARRLLNDAHRADPAAQTVALQLAKVLILDPDPDPERALTLVDAGLKIRPDDPTFLDTRGQVLARLGRWQEAVQELELVLPRIPPNRESHRALARAYRGLNLTTLAETQERKAKELPQ